MQRVCSAVAIMLLGFSSGCSSLSPITVSTPWNKPIPKQVEEQSPAVQHADFDTKVGAVRLAAPAQVAAQAMAPASPVQQVAYSQPVPVMAQQCPPYSEFSPAVARDFSLPAGTDPAVIEMYPDEYLFDGGDRENPVHYDDYHRLGLDTEDTIVEYQTHKGKHEVKKSNRVAVYAPRFAAIRSASSPLSGTSVDTLAATEDTVHGVGLEARTVITQHKQREQLEGIRMRSRASGVETESQQGSVGQTAYLSGHTKLNNLFQDTGTETTGQFEQSDEARIAYQVQAAAIWSRTQFPVIAIRERSAHESKRAVKPEEYIGIEDKRKTEGNLRLIKLADKKNAEPGDVITFTIKYENVGDFDVDGIKIVDNLTPRLEYIQDSATSDRKGRLVVEDNNEGSLILTFEVDETVKGHQGGVVTFQARVR
ncbi:hypothetical protein Pan241w_40820 [Gimesia alba]|uniref:DUF11 domain-containing protein n=1 Tax=Gimesia alba TaxID=2527973 RepID=A0A517RJD4_9PLAN|nr:DUF11 domain-containing protein [Gimesia alba]QDT43978.1 hypothetical protein Pan241w_40820 [Gimesia alba]